MNRPTTVNVLGVTYQIVYVDKPSEVDVFKRDSLWGQVDYWTRTIRVYDLERQAADLWQTIFHEVLHAIGQQLHIDILDRGGARDDAKHKELDILAIALVDVMTRNGWGLGGAGLDLRGIECVERAILKATDVCGLAQLDRPEVYPLAPGRQMALEQFNRDVDEAMSVLARLRTDLGFSQRSEVRRG